jgi:hypothetical protein
MGISKSMQSEFFNVSEVKIVVFCSSTVSPRYEWAATRPTNVVGVLSYSNTQEVNLFKKKRKIIFLRTLSLMKW